jgi:hypothetical protein
MHWLWLLYAGIVLGLPCAYLIRRVIWPRLPGLSCGEILCRMFYGAAGLMDFTGSLHRRMPRRTVGDDMAAAWRDMNDAFPVPPEDQGSKGHVPYVRPSDHGHVSPDRRTEGRDH